MRGLIDYFHRGGSVMWGLLVLAILGLAIIIERFYSLYIKLKGDPKRIVKEISNIIENQGIDAAREYLTGIKSPVAKIFISGLSKVEKGKAVVEEEMARAATTEFAFLDRGMIYLTAVATLAPILGFLGTVTGMIKAFAAIAAAGEVEPTIVAAGISEALITTAAGLFIAAPVALLYAAFADRINNYTRSTDEAIDMLIEYLLESGVIEEEV